MTLLSTAIPDTDPAATKTPQDWERMDAAPVAHDQAPMARGIPMAGLGAVERRPVTEFQ